jgi:L-alanine-DL-glutamate epimerase-like enolase superfamily enzyme
MQSIGEQVFVDPPRPDNNIVRIPAAPGLGLKPNLDKLRESRIEE